MTIIASCGCEVEIDEQCEGFYIGETRDCKPCLVSGVYCKTHHELWSEFETWEAGMNALHGLLPTE